ncbi:MULTISPECIES: hypothetical protein [Delftia]|uniref:Uncharacterized protein n=1 Tax=Delftia lacustris TaxID=558537 RepID=A0A1H3N1E3_9BURK|nr:MULTISPECIES: hypothetical protein [Delftia]PZP74249.1 MAG: hypothetical protein DI604_09400 [Delftia acidovorans]QPS78461.1 hypothetical protein I6G48_32605 [Delftia acidovorans]QPS85020.1 hypothetical protein I6G47_33280 [Delftia lacustris]SDY82563.1 hypothetical protein SAMN05421547_108126 [Delftia lacustris]
MESTVYQATAADRAFENYYFGNGVEVAEVAGWEYTTPGYERTRKVYVETEIEDDGPAPRYTLNFTVRFDPATGALVEATATDSKGQTWGTLAAVVILQLKELAAQIDPDTRAPIVPVHVDGDRLNCFVVVQGDASDEDDGGLPGIFLIELRLARAVAPLAMTKRESSAIAAAVLTEFHENQGIAVLDDFEISVFLEDGTMLEEDDSETSGDDLVAHSECSGQLAYEEIPAALVQHYLCAKAVYNASIYKGVLRLANGVLIDLLQAQATLNAGFQATGDREMMGACDKLSLATGMVSGVHGRLVPSGNADAQPQRAAELAACKTVICAELAGQFMVELLNSVETLSGIAEVHGTCTLADLMYLHSAILSDSFIEHLSAMSKVVDIASALPSGERWATYIHPLKDCE